MDNAKNSLSPNQSYPLFDRYFVKALYRSKEDWQTVFDDCQIDALRCLKNSLKRHVGHEQDDATRLYGCALINYLQVMVSYLKTSHQRPDRALVQKAYQQVCECFSGQGPLSHLGKYFRPDVQLVVAMAFERFLSRLSCDMESPYYREFGNHGDITHGPIF